MFPLILKSRWVLEVLWSTAWACQPYHRVTDPQSQCYLQLWNMKCSYLSSINTTKRGPIWILYLSIPCNMVNLERSMSQMIMTVGSYQKLKWIYSRCTWISFNHFLEVIYSLFAPWLSKNTNSIYSWKKGVKPDKNLIGNFSIMRKINSTSGRHVPLPDLWR